ncbi:aldo/keto reductase [Aestuariibacter halophilus]|uniref:Aldo/keto reductase n=1 Tax=Fluctibacter halophilus TaxID=226011 RepID=A0ABS8GAY8_9ALTE|nr:aldo/keto reductase [Aestuariibacter halophilus]MCC2617750.1 aldo/keto reductase [Aestuariibacter halophilus]
MKTTLPLAKHLPNVSRLAFGCMGLGGSWDNAPVDAEHLRQANEAVDAALEIGINFFDHADIYTRGKAEQVFGQILEQRPTLREAIYLQSKCAIRFADAHNPQRYDFSKHWILQSVDNSLKRLNTEYLDVLLLHRPDPLADPEEVAEAFEQLHSSGKVRHFGVSNMHIHQLQWLQHHLDMPLVANQIEISLLRHDWLDQGVLAGTPQSQHVGFVPGTIEHCQQHGIQLQSWGSLCQGLLSGRDVQDQPDTVKQTAAKVTVLAEHYDVSREAIVLAFLTRHPAGIQPVIGTTHTSRILACGDLEKVTLSREHWYELYLAARGRALP